MGERVAGGARRRTDLSRGLWTALAGESVLLGLACALSLVVALDGDPLPGELRLTRWTQDLPGFGGVADAFRWATGTEGVLVMGAVVAVGLGVAGFRGEGLTLAVALLVLRVLQPTVKNVVDRPRPSTELVERRAGFGSESFPSGHMMSISVLCGVAAVIVWRLPWPVGVKVGLWCGLGLAVVLNGTSSVYTGVHWPSDLLGGLLWAGVIVWPATWVLVWSGMLGRRR